MTLSPRRAFQIDPSWNHPDEAVYQAFVLNYTNKAYRRQRLLSASRTFIIWYPCLLDWFAADLRERVGCLPYEKPPDMTNAVSYNARFYLVFLAWRGYVRFDWDWLLAIRHLRFNEVDLAEFNQGIERLVQTAVGLGYRPIEVRPELRWAVSRLLLHLGTSDITAITDEHLAEAIEACYRFGERPDIGDFFQSADYYQHHVRSQYTWYFHVLHVVLYHQGQISTPPQRITRATPPRPVVKPRMQAVVQRYLARRSVTDEPTSVLGFDTTTHKFIAWIAQTSPQVETWAEVTREHMLDYAEAMKTLISPQTGKPLGVVSRRSQLSRLSVFLADIATWGWEDAPSRPLLLKGDLPKRPQRIPRYIPEQELDRLMMAIRSLPCPFQRAALLTARWSGARREEIGRLSLECLDRYPDGTARLHIPAGKTKRERIVPLNEEAAVAIQEVQALRKQLAVERGFPDRLTGIETRYLFVRHGKLLSVEYLFQWALQAACAQVGLVDVKGKATITAHRFRHTVGKQLAEKGAKLHTIMTVLGHASPHMTLVYAQISDPVVRQDYQAVLGPGATIAGPHVEALRAGKLSPTDLQWLQDNFFKTELELGRCLRLPQEGPCECELYLTCAKFVTTPAYAPRLRRRLRIEQELVGDARQHGWQREVERHHCTMERIEQLLTDLGEPVHGPEAVDECARRENNGLDGMEPGC
jgi:integrase